MINPRNDSVTEFAGLGVRGAAQAIDFVLLLSVITLPLSFAYGNAPTALPGATGLWLALSYGIPAALIIGCWVWFRATPGKMLFRLEVVDAQSGAAMTGRQAFIRYIGFYPSALLLVGMLRIATDPQKQGWHDQWAGTVVVRRPPRLLPMQP